MRDHSDTIQSFYEKFKYIYSQERSVIESNFNSGNESSTENNLANSSDSLNEINQSISENDLLLEAEELIQTNNFDAASRILNTILNYNNNNVDALNDLSVINILLSNYSDAEKQIISILEKDPTNEVALGNKSYLYSFKRKDTSDDFTITNFSSKDEYAQYLTNSKDKLSKRHEFEMSFVKDENDFNFHGKCIVCKEETDFLVDYMFAGENNGVKVPCWRERIICPKCSMNNRMRSFVHYVQEFIKPDENTKIYMTEQTTPLYKYYSQKFSNCIGSEYLGDIFKSGTFNEHNIRNEDITALSFDNETFDLVFSLDVLEHVPNYKKAFQEINRVLKPGGSLIFTVPFAVNSGKNIIRAIIENNKVKHILPPEYHGDPINSEGCLCFQYFGWELMDILKEINYSEAYASLLYSYSYGYLGGDSIIFLAKKSIS